MAYIITSIVSFIAGGIVAWIYRGRIASKLAQVETMAKADADRLAASAQTSIDAGLKKI